MKLRDANERAIIGGRDPLIQKGAIIKSGRSTYRVEHVRGSTVTVSIQVPWHKVIARAAAILSARIRRKFRPARPAKEPAVPIPTLPGVKSTPPIGIAGPIRGKK